MLAPSSSSSPRSAPRNSAEIVHLPGSSVRSHPDGRRPQVDELVVDDRVVVSNEAPPGDARPGQETEGCRCRAAGWR